MIRILSLFLVFTNIFFNSSIIVQDQEFLEQVNNAYNEYCIVDEKVLSVGDYQLVFGKYNNKYYVCCYLYNEGVTNNQYIKIVVNDKNITTYVPDSSVVKGFGLEVEKEDNFTVYILSDSNEQEIATYSVEELINSEGFKKAITGNGTGVFPKNKKEVDAVETIKLFLLGFILLSILFVIILVILYVKRAGRFSGKYQSESLYNFEKPDDELEEDVIDVETDNYEVQKVNKQEIMDRLFEEYRHGDITEEELNEKLKKLWWSEND